MFEHRTPGQWLRELLSLMLGVLLATHVVPGIRYDGLTALVAIVVVLALLNAVLRPFLRGFLMFLSLPLVLLTFGLGALLVLWLVNAILFYLAGVLVGSFTVESFGDAMLGSLVLGAASWLLTRLLGDGGNRRNNHGRNNHGQDAPATRDGKTKTDTDDDHDVIDI